jgi:hypothetical protein
VDVNLAPHYDIRFQRLEAEKPELWPWASNCFVDAQVQKFRMPSYQKVRFDQHKNGGNCLAIPNVGLDSAGQILEAPISVARN